MPLSSTGERIDVESGEMNRRKTQIVKLHIGVFLKTLSLFFVDGLFWSEIETIKETNHLYLGLADFRFAWLWVFWVVTLEVFFEDGGSTNYFFKKTIMRYEAFANVINKNT